jgi:uncharacterized delta-60 repeat protein
MTRSIHNRAARTRRHTFRPRLDALEERQLLSAGALDTATFNPPNGYVLTAFTKNATNATADDVQVQADGKIVVAGQAAGNFGLARYNANGTLDSTFGTGGKVQTSFPNATSSAAEALALQPDGKIVAAGTANAAIDIAVARYNSNGSLDTTFGKNGEVTTALGGTEAQGSSVVIQADGSIVVAGWKRSSSGGYQPAVLRYDATGKPDPSFGAGGIVILAAVSGDLRDVKLQTVLVGGVPTTRIVAAGSTSAANPFVARLNPDGSLDPTFGPGGNGFVILNPAGMGSFYAYGLAVQPDGSIVIAGDDYAPTATNWDIAAARLDPNGFLDTTFNAAGPVPGIATIGTSALAEEGHGVVLQPDGKIVIGGVQYQYPSFTAADSALARFNADGTIDTSFGEGGLAIQSLSSGNDVVNRVALQSDGKIVIAGYAMVGSGSKSVSDFAVARFLNGATTTTTLASSANPSVSGQSVTFTATVTTTGTVSPTGTVQFFDGSTLLGTGTLSTASATTATATFTTSTLAVGTHSITAVYGGDSNDMGSTSAVVSQVVNTMTSTALITSAAPSATPMTALAPSSPSPLLAPLVLDDPGFLTSLVGGKRRRSS